MPQEQSWESFIPAISPSTVIDMKPFSIFVILLTSILAGCTHNDGDIGPLFGSWQLESIEVDGTVDSSYPGNVFWGFQSSIIRMAVVNEHHEHVDYWGTWKLTNNILMFDYTHSHAEMPPGTGDYRFPPSIHLPENGVVSLSVLTLKGSTLTLQYKTTDGTPIVYRLHKQF